MSAIVFPFSLAGAGRGLRLKVDALRFTDSNSRTLALAPIAGPSFGYGSRPIGEGPGILLILAVALAATALPVIFHLAGQFVGIAFSVTFALMIAVFIPETALMTLIFAFAFQNFFVAFVSPYVADAHELVPLRGYNFILTATIWLATVLRYWATLPSFDRRIRRMMTVTTVALVLIGIYFVVGIAGYSDRALIYLRNIVTPFLLFQIFMIIAYTSRVTIAKATIVLAFAALAFGYVEAFAYDQFFPLFHGDVYQTLRVREDYDAGIWVRELRETGRVFRSFRDAMTIGAFNTPFLSDLQLQFYRPGGANFHPISYAYAIAIFGIVLTVIGHWWFALLALPLLFIIGSKGAVILLVTVGLALATIRRMPGNTSIWILVAMLLVYIAGGIVVGLNAQDYHVLGFIGSLNGFLANPFGRGIGAGGSVAAATIDWSRAQHLGYTDGALESAIGVLLYQMGVAGVYLLMVLVWIALKLWGFYRRLGDRLAAAIAFALLTTTANGVFQEEALLAPLALGLVLALAGLVLGRSYRQTRTTPSLRP